MLERRLAFDKRPPPFGPAFLRWSSDASASPDGRWIPYRAGRNIRVIMTRAGATASELEACDEQGRDAWRVDFSPDGGMLTVRCGMRLTLWRYRAGWQRVGDLAPIDDLLGSRPPWVDWLPGGEHLMIGGMNGASLWSTADGQRKPGFEPRRYITARAVTARGNLAVLASVPGPAPDLRDQAQVEVVRLSDGRTLCSMPILKPGEVSSLEVSDTGDLVLGVQQAGAELADDDVTALEAVICSVDRPALRVANGSFETPPGRWAALEAGRAGIEQVIAATGRIQHAGGGMIGTGFLVAADLVMTNRHVAAAFADATADPWVIRLGAAPQIDWRGEHAIREQAEFAIVEVAFVSPAADCDLALLRVDRRHARGVAPPERPLALAGLAPDPAAGRRAVYVVGYPTADRGDTPPEVLRRIFADIYGSKRVQPGEVVSLQLGRRRLDHDCSTLGGNSGSPVVDLDSHQVIGLHFRGAYRRANSAIALWTLAGDPDLARLGLAFRSDRSA